MKKSFCFFVIVLFSSSLWAQNKINLEDLWLNYKYYPYGIDDIRSMSDGEHYTLAEASGTQQNMINKYAYKSGKKVASLLDLSILNNPIIKSFESYEFSSDETKILLTLNSEPIYRHSFKANYYIYDIKTKSLTPLFSKGKITYPIISPTENKVAFVFENNLYYKDLNKDITTQITKDGEWNKIINGLPDWVYEEEFSFTEAFQWSPDGKSIAYLRFDESNVPSFTMPVFGTGIYPENRVFKYPKVGEVNSNVTLHVFQLENNTSTPLKLKENPEYIPRFEWLNTSEIGVFTLNRLQNDFKIWSVKINGDQKVIYAEKSDTYIEISDDFTFLEDRFILKSEKDGFYHFYTFSYDGKQLKQLSKGDFEVTSLDAYDPKNKVLYYTAAYPNPMNRTLFSVSIEGGEPKAILSSPGNHSVNFNSNCSYFIDNHSTIHSVPTYTLYASNGKAIRVLEDNAKLKNNIEALDIKAGEFFEFKTSENIQLNGYMIKPKNFDPNKKYPVFMTVYGGPGSQEVLNTFGGFNYMWEQMLTQEGYIVVCVDNRGTGGRGRDFRTITYNKLGYYETIDQIEAAKYLGKLPYVDASRIGIFGWSYGGYMSSLCITKGADVFKAAIAVAPVTNWKFYDNIYTERYMGTFESNPNGYDDNAPTKFVKNLKGNYFLIHGTADDNVHYQNAAVLSAALVQSNKDFEQFIYTDKNHSIFGGPTRYHLYKKMTDFLKRKL